MVLSSMTHFTHIILVYDHGRSFYLLESSSVSLVFDNFSSFSFPFFVFAFGCLWNWGLSQALCMLQVSPELDTLHCRSLHILRFPRGRTINVNRITSLVFSVSSLLMYRNVSHFNILILCPTSLLS